MLIHTDLPVFQIGRLLGYPDTSNLSRFFRQKKGMSPLQYRRQFGSHRVETSQDLAKPPRQADYRGLTR